MRLLTLDEMRNIDGGASKYVNCPICGYSSKSSALERAFWSNARRKMYLEAKHVKAGQYTGDQSVHW